MWSLVKDATKSTSTVVAPSHTINQERTSLSCLIPSDGRKDFFIEKLFPNEWLTKTLNGKHFKIKQSKKEKLKPNQSGKR